MYEFTFPSKQKSHHLSILDGGADTCALGNIPSCTNSNSKIDCPLGQTRAVIALTIGRFHLMAVS